MNELFLETFKEELEEWKKNNFEDDANDLANNLFMLELNWNNCDYDTHQCCFTEEEIISFLKEIKNDK